jgi:hypothetical protein
MAGNFALNRNTQGKKYASPFQRFWMTKMGINFPCASVVMLGTTAHGESLTGVQKELWLIINDEDSKTALETIIEKISKIGEIPEHFKKLYDEALPYIPPDTTYDKKYWIAAYILYTNKSNLKKLFEELNDANLGIESDKSKQEQTTYETKASDNFEKKIVDEVLEDETKEKNGWWGQYYDVIGPCPGFFLMLGIMKKVIKNINYNPENFNKLYHESISKYWDWDDESNFDKEDWVAMRILKLEKSTIDNIEDELHNIQYELHELEYDDLPYAELEMYEAEDEERKKVLEGKIIEMEKRIQELETRKKRLLIMFCKLAKKFGREVSSY